MSIKSALRLNVAWAVIMLIAFTLLEIGLHTSARLLMLSLAILYLAVAVLASRGWRSALALSVAVALLEAVWGLPTVVINVWMFVTGDGLYRDSPATILVVLIEAILFAIPASVLCVAYVFQWRQLQSLFVAGADITRQSTGTA
jgi:hypothetical protein